MTGQEQRDRDRGRERGEGRRIRCIRLMRKVDSTIGREDHVEYHGRRDEHRSGDRHKAARSTPTMNIAAQGELDVIGTRSETYSTRRERRDRKRLVECGVQVFFS
jgi:hypothetical protein